MASGTINALFKLLGFKKEGSYAGAQNTPFLIPSESANDTFLVLGGTWNNVVIFTVMPKNGAAPQTNVIVKYGNGTTTSPFTVEENDAWGCKITNTDNPVGMPFTVYRFRRYI